MQIADAQREMRSAYLGGGPGALVSAVVWLVCAFVLDRHGVQIAFAALFVGGMLIFPAGTFICRAVLRCPKESGANPFGATAMEGTFAMLAGFFAAWLMLNREPAFALPLAALAVGSRYLLFKTIYGARTYWLFGAVLSAIGLAGVLVADFPTMIVVLSVAFAEIGFGIVLYVQSRREKSALADNWA